MMLMMFIFLIIMINLKMKNFFKKILIQIILDIMLMNILLQSLFSDNWYKIFFYFGMEFFNYSLILLTLWIMMLVINSLSIKIYKFNYCLNILLILMMILILSFMSMDMFFFYLFFEISLIPTFIIIIIWGMGSERISSGYYLLFYTMFFSFPMLSILFFIFNNVYTSMMFLIEQLNFSLNSFFYLMLMSTFLIKLPLFFMHSWLLKAHVEAPYFGSMILAALLLKLGSYGLLRFIYMFKFNSLMYSCMLIVMSLMGMLIISLMCLRQIDMKMIIAYSSVVHMGMLICGMFTLTKIGIIGSYLMMISHGLCSSGLFFLINVIYNKSNSRLMLINKGMMMLIPNLGLMWFLLCSSNMSAPMSLNLISELLLLSSLMFYFFKLLFFLFMVCFFSFLYSLYLFSFIFHGNKIKNKFKLMKFCFLIDFYVILMHWIPLNIMFLNMMMFLY